MSFARVLAAVAVVSLSLCACAPAVAMNVPRVGARPPPFPNDAAEAEYRSLVARFSDHQELYDRFDTRFFCWATFQSPRFREARVRRAADFRRIPAAEVEKQLAEERTGAAAAHEVFLAAHFTDPRFDDLDRPRSQWRLALVTPRGEVTPTKVERLGRSTMDQRSLYPYFDEFWVGFHVTFPRAFPDGTEVIPEGTDAVTLRLASALGNAELRLAVR
ncbi:MAG TPA: hypothetical protein VFA20_12135 [Myxococcaceae bacterium]|nr:hypothetical protein [Myxococcaceae bacterium]